MVDTNKPYDTPKEPPSPFGGDNSTPEKVVGGTSVQSSNTRAGALYQ